MMQLHTCHIGEPTEPLLEEAAPSAVCGPKLSQCCWFMLRWLYGTWLQPLKSTKACPKIRCYHVACHTQAVMQQGRCMASGKPSQRTR